VGEARRLPFNGAPERCFSWVGSGLTHKHKTRLKRLARDDQSKSLQNPSIMTVKRFTVQTPVFKKSQIWGQAKL
jgi:hypothetical protein